MDKQRYNFFLRKQNFWEYKYAIMTIFPLSCTYSKFYYYLCTISVNEMRIVRALAIIATLLVTALADAGAQENTEIEIEVGDKDCYKAFNHLDLAINVGTTGIGFELATPIGEYVMLRAGFDYMPRFTVKMNFGIQVGDDPTTSQSKFEKMQSMLEQFTGFEVNNSVDMIGKPTFYNFKLLVDVYPFKNNKKWHFTGGFYWGNSQIAEAYNTTEDMPSLMAVQIYNHMYEYFTVINEEYGDYNYVYEPFYDDYYIDPDMGDQMREKFENYGRMGINMGTKKDGTAYIMEPDENGMAKAKVKANSFKPYLGFGYGTTMDRKKSYKISFDCGVLFWGGTPQVITHDGTDLINDMSHVKGKVGTYVDIIEQFKVYPVINFRIAKTLF